MRRFTWALAVAGCTTTPTGPTPVVPNFTLPEARRADRSELVLRCTPPDAEVSLDGVPQGACEDYDGAPQGLALGRGARRVEVKKRGFLPWESWMQADGTRVVIDVRLVAKGGSTP